MITQPATNTRRYDFDEQILPPPLNFDLPDDEPEFVGNRPQEEIVAILQEGVELSLYVALDEYCIRWKDGKFAFVVWRCDTDRIYSQEYDTLEMLLRAEKSRTGFELSAFELIC